MRCKPGKLISHVVIGAVVLAGLNIFFLLVSTWVDRTGSLQHRPVRSYEIKPQYRNIVQEAPLLQPTNQEVQHQPTNQEVQHQPTNQEVQHQPTNQEVQHQPTDQEVQHQPTKEEVQHQLPNQEVQHQLPNQEAPLLQPTNQEAPLLQPTNPCPGLRMSHPQEGSFQTVVRDQLYVYSAFLDKGSVRIIAMRRSSNATTLRCLIWYQPKEGDTPSMLGATPRMAGATPRMTDATVENLPEDHERRFTAAFIICGLPSDAQDVTPLAVSVLAPGDPCPEVTNTLLVQLPGHLGSEFTVCVTPLNFRYSRAFELVEWIELNRLLGADKFVFYNHSTGPNVDQVLEMYTKEGIVDVHPWKLPVQTDTWPPTKKPEIHYFAQIASLNDCLYRYQNRSQYLVYEDLDEFIIPRNHDTWRQMILAREKLNTDVSAFIFRCVFFRKEWLSPAKQFQTFARMYKSVVLSYTKRESVWQLPGVRSKFIVNPRTTSAVGVHQVWESAHRQDLVPKEFASLHHYRNWERPTDTQRQVEDWLVAEKYGLLLVQQLEKAWSKLAGVPMDINITIYGDYV